MFGILQGWICTCCWSQQWGSKNLERYFFRVTHDSYIHATLFFSLVPTALTNYNTNTGPSLVREGELQVDCKGKEYASPDDGYAFSIPPGSIPEGKTITFKHGIVSDGPFGPFEFPTDVRPVSSILSLHATIEQPLLKPIEIALPHIIHCENADDHKQLAVFKATCNDFRIGRNGEHIFSFKKVSSANLTIMMCQGFPYAKFSTCHCCYMCYGVCSKEDTDNALFCFVEAIPRVIRQSRPLIHFCVIFFLPTCLKVFMLQEHSYTIIFVDIILCNHSSRPSVFLPTYHSQLWSTKMIKSQYCDTHALLLTVIVVP